MSGKRAPLDHRLVDGAGGLSFINNIDAQLRVIAELQLATAAHHVIRLRLRLFYSGKPAGVLSFDLNGFSPAEAVALARDIAGNHTIMREIDEYLCGDLVE
jgi:hypothetical protein